MNKNYIFLSLLTSTLFISGCSTSPKIQKQHKILDKNITILNPILHNPDIAKMKKDVDYTSIPRDYIPIYFDFNRFNLKEDQKASLHYDVNLALCDMAKKVNVIGYADSVGNEVVNYKLALKRADAVAQYLIEQGVNPKKIVLKSAGNKFSKCTLSNKKCNMRNRKVEIAEETK